MNPLDLIKKIVLGILHQDGIIHASIYPHPDKPDHVNLEATMHKDVAAAIIDSLPKDGSDGRSD